MTLLQPSTMFEPRAEGALASAMDWITGTLLGSVAIALCVLAVAFIGLAMLGGHLPVRRGLQTIVGCFVLLGAPVIASGLMGTWEAASPREILIPPPDPTLAASPREDLPPATYDPYAGASLRDDR